MIKDQYYPTYSPRHLYEPVGVFIFMCDDYFMLNMDRWAAMETDAGWAVMKTPATKAKALFKVVLPTPVVTTFSISRAVKNHLAIKYSK